MSYLGKRELARRICAAAHPHYATTGNVVPCGEHDRAAALYDELTTEKGTKTLAVILAARVEAGIDKPVLAEEARTSGELFDDFVGALGNLDKPPMATGAPFPDSLDGQQPA